MTEALASPERAKWMDAMDKEMNSLHMNDVWDLVKLPKDRKAVGSKWVFKLKVGSDGQVERHKARLVAQGFAQKQGLDYDETFSPVVRFESLRTVIALAVQNGMKMHQMDVTTAFLNGELQEEVYMKQPEGFVAEGQEDLVCKLKRSIYGLKQSPRCWNAALDHKLKQMGFVQAKGDPCLYMASEGEMFIIAVYVDDIVLAGKGDQRIAEVKQALAHQFQVKDMGELHYFLGVKVVRDKDMFQLGETAISWRSKKQTCVALSTAEAEYMALASAAQEAMWLRQLIIDLKNEPVSATVIFEDNQSAICMAKNPQFHGRSKHIAIKYHFIRDQVENNNMELKYCRTNDMIADMLTKGLNGEQFAKLRHMAGVREVIDHSVCQ